MAKFFISYSRSVKDDVIKVIELLRSNGHEVWWDADIPIMADWWATILTNIEWCDVFIFVTSEKSVESAYCIAELKYASDLQCPILPFIIDDPTLYKLPSELPSRSQWLMYNGDPSQMLSQIDVAYENIDWALYKSIPVARPPEPMTGGKSLAKQFQDALHLANSHDFDGAKHLLRNIKSLDYDEWGSECDEWLARLSNYESIVDLTDDDSTLTRAQVRWQEHTVTYGHDFDPNQINARLSRNRLPSSIPFVPILSVVGILAILALIFAFTSTPSGDCEITVKKDENLSTITAKNVGVTIDNISVKNNLENPNIIRVGQKLVIPNINCDLLTVTPLPTATALPTATPHPAIELARTPVESNEDWTPVEDNFGIDEIIMVLVPVGSFMMGDSSNSTHQSISEPFWIDKYEVSQADFKRLGGKSAKGSLHDGANNPVERISWFEARDFCELRGARLPTELEWEYAARGPKNLIYPWGNDENLENVVYEGNAGNKTANVESFPAGESWVNARHMSGNVLEWVSSLYKPYPYNPVDGREDMNNRIDQRVLRGGSYVDSGYRLTSTFREPTYPEDRGRLRINAFMGFRCARPVS